MSIAHFSPEGLLQSGNVWSVFKGNVIDTLGLASFFARLTSFSLCGVVSGAVRFGMIIAIGSKDRRVSDLDSGNGGE